VARLAGGVYAFTVTGLYGVSAAYHRLKWSPRAVLRMQRLDHSMIYLLIAGTYTPVCVLVLQRAWAFAMLAVVWTTAVAGVAMKQFGMEATRKIGGALYIVLGWAAVLCAPAFAGRISLPVLALIGAGGVLYTLGAIVLFRQRPDPNPLVFGYHEVWHVMVVLAGACHYAAIMLLVLTRGG
jgi:hemolysin III